MNKKIIMRTSVLLLVAVMALILLLGQALDPVRTANTSEASYIKQLNAFRNDYTDYLDSSVIYKLPDGVKDDDIISVIIKMNTPTLLDTYDQSGTPMSFTEYSVTDEAKALREEIQTQANGYLAELNALGVTYETGMTYSAIMSGFEILIRARDFEKTCGLLGDRATPIVGEVYNAAETQLVENNVSVYETGIFDSSAFRYDGSGMVVAVLDTGLDYTHSAFSTTNFTSSNLGLTREQVAAVLGKTNASTIVSGLSADDVYVNNKVPFAFDYADKDTDVYSLRNNHGTHVSGIIAGRDTVITGVAPNAQLVPMKIFSDTVDGARTSWVLAALEDCVTLGVDVINMSLGTACGFSRESDREIISGVYENIRSRGISLVVAASNSFSSSYGSQKNGNLGLTSNPDTSTVGSPSTYHGALSIASINGEKTPYILYNNTIIYFMEATNSAGDEKDFFGELLTSGANDADLEYVLVPGAGRPADYTGMDVRGKIVLVRRGSNTFEEKAEAAAAQGAAGIIIYNNVSGEIRMNAGTSNIPICSIGQDDGELLAQQKSGTIRISRSQVSGPFMSDFSSWGPTPNLEIKPEITAHGGNILSAVTGGSYDRISGTSMACPNMAGVVALLRQYVIAEFPQNIRLENGEIDNVKVAAIVNRLLMSTADIVINKNGLPYAVRKQGAGLANLTSSAATTAYILTYNKDGSVMDKSKIELGDDPAKTGVYTLRFAIDNFGNTTLSYDVSAYVMTEGVSETKTNNGKTTVTEEGYILSGATVAVTSVQNGSLNGSNVTVEAGKTAEVTVTITLSDSDKQYLDASFENGMYVEGFVVLDAVSGTQIDLSVPYLAFYGDWTRAPMFDLDYYATNADELDDSIELLDKTLPDAYATRPVGGVSSDFVSYLGSYYFTQNPANKVISASRDYIALSNTEGTVHSLRFVWAGMLRNAEKIVITITDDATGEVVFERVEHDIRKSYSDGGSTVYPAAVNIEFDAGEHNLKNNTEYTVKLQGYMDYGDGGLTTNLNNTFEFPLVADFEAPAVTGCEFYTEYDKDQKKTRLFARIAVYDNHYAMAMQTGYVSVTTDSSGNSTYDMTPFETYLTPIYSDRDSTTYVVYELTDFVYDIKNNSLNKNTFTVSCYDYALNEATYEISLPDQFIDFYLEDTSLTLSPNELYTITPLIYPDTEWPELLSYTSSNERVVRVVNNKLVAVAPGTASVFIYDPKNPEHEIILPVKVLAEGEEGYRVLDKPVADVFTLDGYQTLKAYYYLSHTDRDIGTTGDLTLFGNSNYYSLSMFPSESVGMRYRLDAYFPDATEVVFESGNERIVSVNQNGVIVANAEGFASVTVRVLLDGKSTYYSETINITVKDPYITNGPSLTHYFGNGGIVEIPSSLLLTEIGNYAFSNFDYIDKDENDEISEEEPDHTKIWYLGDDTVTKVIIPEGVEKIGAYAFANLTALTEVVLPSTLESIDYGAFYGCTSLTKVTGIEHVKLINKDAFNGCNLGGTLSLDSAHAIGDFAFAYNANLKEVVLPETLRSIGAYAFALDEKLASVTIHAEKAKFGPYVFAGCAALTDISINATVIPTGAFYGCAALENVTLGKDVSTIGEYAFAGTAVRTFAVDAGNTTIKTSQAKDCLLSADGSTLLLAAPGIRGAFTLNDPNVKAIGNGAFSGNNLLTQVSIPSVTSVGDYAFADCVSLRTVTLGTLEQIGSYAFCNTSITECPSFEKLTEIGAYAFAYTDIVSVVIPDGMKVGEGAFCECQRLASVRIGNNAVIGTGAFQLSRDAEHERSGQLNNWEIASELDPETGRTVYYFRYLSALHTLVIGDNVTIGDNAFFGAANLTEVTLGAGAVIGERAFYNACSLRSIDLSRVQSIGHQAFSGDVLYVYSGNQMGTPLVKNGSYVYRYYAPMLESVDLSSLTAMGEQAFRYCKNLKEVKLGTGLTNIPYMAFADCDLLTTINLSGVQTLGDGAFSQSGLRNVDLSAVTDIGDYAFLYCEQLAGVKLNPNGCSIGEGAFAYCSSLRSVENLNCAEHIDAYGFAYSALTEADLSGAVTIGDHAFMKSELTPFRVQLGSKLKTLGDNPFAMCRVEPFSGTHTETFNGKDYTTVIYTFDISDTVSVINGSLYCRVPNGWELITYTGMDPRDVQVADGTVRITALAFAGSDVVMVTLPQSLASVGHKAFYDCNSLIMVIFKSYEAPNLEEEFDQTYYESFDNIPATGTFDFAYYDGTEVTKEGLGIVPYYMWNATSGKYSNAYYGANFVNYIGHVERPIIMVRPSNGIYYDTFIFGQYFASTIDGAVAPDDITLAAIEAINRLPNPVQLSDEALVIAARAAYDRIATKEQQALVTNYDVLLSAEKRIQMLKDDGSGTDDPGAEDPKKENDVAKIVLIVLVVVESVCLVGLALWFTIRRMKREQKQAEPKPEAPEDATEQDESAESAESVESSESAESIEPSAPAAEPDTRVEEPTDAGTEEPAQPLEESDPSDAIDRKEDGDNE